MAPRFADRVATQGYYRNSSTIRTGAPLAKGLMALGREGLRPRGLKAIASLLRRVLSQLRYDTYR